MKALRVIALVAPVLLFYPIKSFAHDDGECERFHPFVPTLCAFFDGDATNNGVRATTENTAILVTDPQNDFLFGPEGCDPNPATHPPPGTNLEAVNHCGAAWFLVGKSVQENKTRKHIEDLMRVAKRRGILLVISPHWYYPHDRTGAEHDTLIENFMNGVGMFATGTAPSTRFEVPEGSGADFLERYKPYVTGERSGARGKQTVIANPHKVYAPRQNDVSLQMRKRGIRKVILAGMSANLCTESHLRELLEDGFEVAVARDATAAADITGIGAFPDTPQGTEDEARFANGYRAAMTNFMFTANLVETTANIVKRLRRMPRRSGRRHR